MAVSARTMVVIDDGVPRESIELLRAACACRGVTFDVVEARDFDFASAGPLEPGTLLFRPATSRAAMRVEQHLWGPGVVTFHRSPADLHRAWPCPTLVLARAGVPVPRTTYVCSRSRERLRGAVAWAGGLPVVLKGMGSEGGVGVVRVDTMAGLFSTVDLALAQGMEPELCEYVADALHWRLVVVGERVVAAYPNPTMPGDFRSAPSEDPREYRGEAPAGLGEVAVRAVAAFGVEFGGVDVLVDGAGRPWVLEVNSPCYYPQAQEVAGIDVAGAMVDHLLMRAGVGPV